MSETKLNVICVLGGPGAGKTTLCTVLMNKIPNSIILKSGALIRASISNIGNGDCQDISSIMDKGGLVADDVVCKIVNDEIVKVSRKTNVHNVILDGYPRTLKQLQHFDATKITLCGILILEVPDLILEKRCKIRNLRTDRIDDLEEPVVERVSDYRQHIGPIVADVEQNAVKFMRLSTNGSVEETGQKAVAFALQLSLN